MEPLSTMMLPERYGTTVNESETIIEAQPFCLVRSDGDTCELRASGSGLPAPPHIERS
jgi:hypothetical protein